MPSPAITAILAAVVVIPAMAPRLHMETATPRSSIVDTTAIKEWQVPWEKTRPRDPYVDPSGKVWFVGQAGHYIGSLDPKTGKFARIELEDGAGPHNLIVDKNGTLWYSGNRTGYIGKVDPKTGQITRIKMPDEAVKDPHTLIFDQKGDIWFTAQQAGYVGKLTVATSNVQLVKVGQGTRPYGIVIDSKGRPWFNEFGTNKLGTVDPATMQLKEYTLPAERARGRRIALTSDDKVWYGDYSRGFLGRLDPTTGKIDEWALPGGATSLPYAMTVDDRDRLWLAETGKQPNKLVGFDSESMKWTNEIAVPSGGLSVRHMVFHKPSRSIWFGTDANTIGRVLLP